MIPIHEIKFVSCLIILILASHQDIKTREISIKYPIAISIIGISSIIYEFFVIKTLKPFDIFVSIISGIIIFSIIYITGLMGYGDAFIYLSLAIAFPYIKLLPAIIDIFMNSILLSAFIPLILFIYNLKNIKYLKSIKDIPLMFTSYPKRKSEIGKFEIIVKEKDRKRIIFNVEKVDFSKPENSEEIVWVTYGLPFVIFITIGFVAYFFYGNILLKLFLNV